MMAGARSCQREDDGIRVVELPIEENGAFDIAW